MKSSRVCNRSLLQIIAKKGDITYAELKAQWCCPNPIVITHTEAMLDSDLKVLELEGYIEITENTIKYIG